jgi:2,4-dienoyl-CoA reductase-like NADH-dependent reductase (Old Yellow Enzyme family)
MSSPALFEPIKVGTQELKHRVVLAPLTRMRADRSTIPNDMMQDYYAQRATPGGLLICEATNISRTSGSYVRVPGIYTKEQIAAWKKITDAVHAKGGIIYLQLWHIGRAAFAALNLNKQSVSASGIPIGGMAAKNQPYETPRPLMVPEIKSIVQDYRQAALNAVEAGFDGVEIHSANGYLLDQFINTSSNRRTDSYGGSIENRCRFSLEVVDAVVGAIGAERTGIRFSPWSGFQDMKDATPYDTWGYLTQKLQDTHPNLSFLHFVEPRSNFMINGNLETVDSLDHFRNIWKGPFIAAGGYTYDRKLAFDTAEKTGNLIAFGRTFIANPDLVDRLRNEWPLNHYNRKTFYGGNTKGYTDYPSYESKL